MLSAVILSVMAPTQTFFVLSLKEAKVSAVPVMAGFVQGTLGFIILFARVVTALALGGYCNVMFS